jgi:two-component system response regulator FixJ
MKRQVLLFGEQPKQLDILSCVLEKNYEVRLFTSRSELLAAVNASGAMCLVADVSIPSGSGVELVQAVRARCGGEMPVVIVIEPTDIQTAVQIMRAGAIDLLEKPTSASRLLDAVRRAIAIAEAFYTTREAKIFWTLSAREQEVAVLLAAGRTSKQAGDVLGISPRTVDIHRGKLLRKLDVPNVAALASVVGRATRC